MRTPTTLWVATLALFSAPLLITVDAAPAPHAQTHQQQKRYLVPVRRQASGASFVNSSPSQAPDTVAPVVSVQNTVPSPVVEQPNPPAAASSAAPDAGTSPAPKANTGSNLLSNVGNAVNSVVDGLTGGQGGAQSSQGGSAPSSADPPAAAPSSQPNLVNTLLSNPLVVGLNTILSDIIPSSVPSDSAPVAQVVQTLLSNVVPSDVVGSSVPSAVSSGSAAVVTPPPTVPAVGALLNGVGGIASDLGVGLQSLASNIAAGAGTIVSDLGAGVATVASGVVNPVASVISDVSSPSGSGGVLDPLLAPVQSIVSAAVPVVTGVTDPLVQSVVSNLGSAASNLPAAVIPAVESVASDLGSVPSNLPAAVVPAVQSVASDLGSVASNLPAAVIPVVESVASDLGAVATGITDPIVQSVASDLGSVATGAPVVVVPPVESIISNVVGSLPSDIPVIPPPVQSFISESLPNPTGIPDGVIPPVQSFVSNIIPVVTGNADPIIAPVQSFQQGFSAPVALPTGGVPFASENAPVVVPATILPPKADPLPSLPGGAQPNPTGIAIASGPSNPNPVPAISALANAPGVVMPTGTDSETALALPSVILVNASPTATVALVNAPQVLQPPGGTPVKGPDETLVQIGFNKSLNYAFVSTTERSASQIFTYLPQGMSHGLALDTSAVRIQSIQPYDTLKQMGFVTTLALIYIPTNQVDKLNVLLHTPTSDIYGDNGQPQVNALMPYINPAIPLLAGQTMGDGTVANAQSLQSSVPGSSTGASPFGPDSANTEPVRVQSATIATSSALAGAAFATAMVFIANRYRQRRRSSVHRRSSSLPNDPVWMSEARNHSNPSRNSRGSGNSNGRSIRSGDISAPVMQQNSLGWT
jgi:hypothetical protein